MTVFPPMPPALAELCTRRGIGWGHWDRYGDAAATWAGHAHDAYQQAIAERDQARRALTHTLAALQVKTAEHAEAHNMLMRALQREAETQP